MKTLTLWLSAVVFLAMGSAGITPKVFAGAAAGFTLPEFRRLAGNAAENVFSATLWTPQVFYPGAREYYHNYSKKFGPVRFTSYDNKTQQNSLPTFLVQWQKGVLETVWPRTVASRTYVYSE
jgi:branched-chain amino acid transport system substrate-binding protein